ncbi:DNA/RNA helicase domain-containing protein [Streptomyces rubiginosohelvolus]|uniref:DNA/RNA helicase domain-containing protein n=1 Tax=Streptomyces rubiginosohelvolus TaxID=67362 RepID=UPI00368D675F
MPSTSPVHQRCCVAAAYVSSGSRAFNGALKDHVGYGDGKFKKTFTYFSSFVRTPDPPLDVPICDEAHRLRNRSNGRQGREQVGYPSAGG